MDKWEQMCEGGSAVLPLQVPYAASLTESVKLQTILEARRNRD